MLVNPHPQVADLGGSPAQVLVIDFSYRLLDLGVPGEFEFFNGTAEWTPPVVHVTFAPSPLYQDILGALRQHTLHPIPQHPRHDPRRCIRTF